MRPRLLLRRFVRGRGGPIRVSRLTWITMEMIEDRLLLVPPPSVAKARSLAPALGFGKGCRVSLEMSTRVLVRLIAMAILKSQQPDLCVWRNTGLAKERTRMARETFQDDRMISLSPSQKKRVLTVPTRPVKSRRGCTKALM